jgi:fatty acid/phospholipid biosynthesis enzyme
MRIGIDIMGGDYAPGSTIRGSILAREALPDQIELFLFGDQDVIHRYSEEHQLDISGMTIVHTPHSVSMGDHPFKAFREKPAPIPNMEGNSSLLLDVGLNMGQEAEKGNMATRSAYQMMKDSLDFDFIGNFE